MLVVGEGMSEDILETIRRSVQAAENEYYCLVLLVGETGSGKTSTLRAFAEESGSSVININMELSRELLGLTTKQRPLRLPDILDSIAKKTSPPIVLDNTEILFDRDLKQDPLRLLQSMSRNRVVMASWNGSLKAGRLMYAEPGHSEYRSYDAVDALIVGMDGTATIDPGE